jgi:hypothetical protein
MEVMLDLFLAACYAIFTFFEATWTIWVFPTGFATVILGMVLGMSNIFRKYLRTEFCKACGIQFRDDRCPLCGITKEFLNNGTDFTLDE